MHTSRPIVLFLLVVLLLGGQVRPSTSATTTITAQAYAGRTMNLRPLKVHMDSRTLWSDGQYTPLEMAAAARTSGYDAVFFADNVLHFGETWTLADPGFEHVAPAGNFTYWNSTVRGPLNTVAYAGPYRLPALALNGNSTQLDAYLYSRLRVRSGNYSLHLEVRSRATNYTAYGFATASPVFPAGYIFSQPTPGFHPPHPLLASSITFSAYALFDSLLEPSKHVALPPVDPGDDGWFYLRFTLINSASEGPYSQEGLTITLVWSAQPVDAYLFNILHRNVLNDTTSKTVYFNPPPMEHWVPLNVNVTDLALRLWNRTIVDQWRLGSLIIGAKSGWDALVSVYVDDAVLSSSPDWRPLHYFRSIIQPQLSNGTFRAYQAYSVDPAGSPIIQPTMNVYNTTYFDQNQNYNLTDDAVWKALSDRISSNGGLVALGVIKQELSDYIAAKQGFGVQLIDGTTYGGILVARDLLLAHERVVFVATSEAAATADYNSSNTWSMWVYAGSNSESDILNAISEGQAYLAVSNFTGTFSFDPYGFPIPGGLPIYVPIDENLTLPIDFNQATRHDGTGIVRVYQDARLDARIPYTENASIDFSDFLRSRESHFFATVSDPINDSLLIITNPITFAQADLIPNGALFIDNGGWTIESSQWTTLAAQQSYHLALQAPNGTTATLYLYSPTFAPNAKNQSQLARWLSVANQRVEPASVYNDTTSTFIIHLKSTGQPVDIMINFDMPLNTYFGGILSSAVTLYLIAILPFAIAIILIVSPRRIKRKFSKIGR